MFNKTMAKPQQVREYLAFWFQLGKRVILPSTQQALLPEPIFENGSYSKAFEHCWGLLQDPAEGDAFLEGTPQTIHDLLTLEWEILPCSRCEMPVPVIDLGMPVEGCPCSDLLSWPNQDIPVPRSAVHTHQRLTSIQNRLQTWGGETELGNCN